MCPSRFGFVTIAKQKRRRSENLRVLPSIIYLMYAGKIGTEKKRIRCTIVAIVTGMFSERRF
jgi:hypothetical protein